MKLPCFGLKPKHLAADTVYGTGKFLGWLIGAGITPHIPVWDKSTREDGTLSRSDFRWDKRRGVYVCPNNKVLHTSGTVHDGRTLLYRASKLDCDTCPLKARCCPGQLARKIPRDVHEDARDLARRLMGSKSFIKSRDERKRVEMRFAHLKIQHGFERMRLRGLSGARDEFHLAAIVQNLKTLALRALGALRDGLVTAQAEKGGKRSRRAEPRDSMEVWQAHTDPWTAPGPLGLPPP